MVTFKQVYDVEANKTISINTEGCFVLPISWLFVMSCVADQIEVKPELLDKKNFTDEMLCDLLIDFKSMSVKSFMNSRYANVDFAVCNWAGDKQWYAYKSLVPSKTKIIFKNSNIVVQNMLLYDWISEEDKKYRWKIVNKRDFENSDPTGAHYNLRYAKVLKKFSNNVAFKGEHECSQTIILGTTAERSV